MTKEIPTFETQLRGFDRGRVTDYISNLYIEIEELQYQTQTLEHQIQSLERDARWADTDRGRQDSEVEQLRSEIQRLSGPIDSVEGMSDRIARMMRVASDEARRTKTMAREEAESLTHQLHEQLEAARQERDVASATLTEFQASVAARRELILLDAQAEAEQILQSAHGECARLIEETDEADRRRREIQLRLAEEDDRRRRESIRRLDEQIAKRWEQTEAQVVAFEEESRLKAASLVATAERTAQSIHDRAEANIKELIQTRGDVLSALSAIQSQIETAVRRDQISVVRTSTMGDGTSS